MEKLRFQSRRLGPLSRDALYDLAAEKALELMGKHDCGQWKPLERTAGELVNFISSVARNALVDDLRRAGRQAAESCHETVDGREAAYRAQEAPELQAERREFIVSLVACAERLKPEHRTVWLLRVLHELPSRSIADHPEVRLKPGHVDVILGRCRAQIRTCMKSRGLDSGTLPPGTCTELWDKFRSIPRGES